MTITLRSASTSTATTKGAPLSYAELDANFTTLAAQDVADRASLAADTGASLVGFLQSGSGAVARTAQAKMREEVSVLDFGATGDGVADDEAECQAAIDTGKRVIFPEGYTFLTGGLTCDTAKQEIVLRGIVKLKDAANESVFTVNANRVKFNGGGEINGNKANQTATTDATGTGIWIADGIDNVEVIGLYIHDCRRNGVAGYGNSNDCVVKGNEIGDCGYAAGMMAVFPTLDSGRPTERWLIADNYLYGWTDAAVGTVGIRHAVISGNRIVCPVGGSAINAIALEANCDFTTIIGNTIEGSSTTSVTGSGGVQINDSNHVACHGNTFEGLLLAATIHGGAANSFNVSFTGNVIDDCGYAGYAIIVNPTDANHDYRVVIANNTINNSPYAAIFLSGASHSIVTGNQIYGVNLQNTASKRFVSAITLLNQSYYNTVSNNVIIEGTGGNLVIGIHEMVPGAGNGSGANTIKDNRIVGADYDIVCSGTAQGLTAYSKVVRTLDAAVTAAPSTGHWERGDEVLNEQPASGGAPGWVCTTGGTFGAQSATAAAVNTSTTLTFANAADAAKFHPGMKVSISDAAAGPVALVTYILAMDGTALTCTLKDAATADNPTATVTCSNPVFKAMANLA